VPTQKWISPTAAASPPPWVVKRRPPEWVSERARSEGSPADTVDAWRAALIELGVAEVRSTSDVRGVTIDFDGTAPQTVNDAEARRLSSAMGRGIDRLRTQQKSDEGIAARRLAPDSPRD
jgi:hypothetical protein